MAVRCSCRPQPSARMTFTATEVGPAHGSASPLRHHLLPIQAPFAGTLCLAGLKLRLHEIAREFALRCRSAPYRLCKRSQKNSDSVKYLIRLQTAARYAYEDIIIRN